MDRPRWEDMPVDEIHEWIYEVIHEEIAKALEEVASEISISYSKRPQFALEMVASRLRANVSESQR